MRDQIASLAHSRSAQFLIFFSRAATNNVLFFKYRSPNVCVICPPQHFCDTMWDRIARAPSVSSFLVFSDSAHLLAIGKDDCTHEECGTIRPWPQSLTKARPVESTVHVQGKEYAIDTVCGDGGREGNGTGGGKGGGDASMSRRARKQKRRNEEEELFYENLDVEMNL